MCLKSNKIYIKDTDRHCLCFIKIMFTTNCRGQLKTTTTEYLCTKKTVISCQTRISSLYLGVSNKILCFVSQYTIILANVQHLGSLKTGVKGYYTNGTYF
uniref:Uncharacterized protein n=1 Tax=Cacopsylla melanoneura TaxID=428564 RepID=A0A8D9FC69_9HEMI